ncbi:MAG TPA: PP2C family protein-serine/threonine phosphatase, partial [Burkholderiales bacterium]|nr:PP2C family protein-serine/threonine phosphatase [Burkholderiales bacterium]
RMRRTNDALLQGFKQQLVLEHIQRELRFAREIQASMLPKGLPAAAPRSAVDVFAAMEPARQVGGDLYDYFYTPDGRLCFLVGDVSDKGMPAALFMARTVDIVRVVCRLLRSAEGEACEPGDIIACVNRELCQNNASFMFVTMFFGVFDPARREVAYCNAGHNPPYLVRAGHEPQSLGGARSNPLGVKADSAYATRRAPLQPEQTLFVFSDGITEAMAGDDSFYGEERLTELLRTSRAAGPRELVGAVIAAVKDFVGDSPQSDDITALALRAGAAH